MALGKEIGEFSMKVTSVIHEETSAHWNVQGLESSGGTAQATLTFTGGADSERGAMSGRGVVFMKDGTRLNNVGEGIWNTVGQHKWRIRMLNSRSDGLITLVDSELDLATLSWQAKVYEWS
jgi:hypothetical protein